LEINPDQKLRGDALEDITAAFREFASGNLSLKHDGTNEPDSGYFFLFAEFALAALKVTNPGSSEFAVSASQREVWQALLPALVASQPVFMAAYAPKDGKR